jgi:hypothetical protein
MISRIVPIESLRVRAGGGGGSGPRGMDGVAGRMCAARGIESHDTYVMLLIVAGRLSFMPWLWKCPREGASRIRRYLTITRT